MGRRTAIPALLAALALLASAACSDGGADRGSAGANPTVPTDPPRTTLPAPTTTNPYAVPAVIDAAYVNRVLAGLDAAVGDVVRLVIRTKTIPPEALERLRAVYIDPSRIQRSIDGFQRDIRTNFSGYQANPGNKTTTVTELMTATRSCIFAKVHRDFSAVGVNPPPAVDPQWVALKPLQRTELAAYNATAWAYVYDGFEEDHSRPANLCVN